eukprot:Hpha_TRINITY_DN15844_c1_g1::TRINITY_DN15844_c1_g1_i4::g.187240::m.187240
MVFSALERARLEAEAARMEAEADSKLERLRAEHVLSDNLAEARWNIMKKRLQVSLGGASALTGRSVTPPPVLTMRRQMADVLGTVVSPVLVILRSKVPVCFKDNLLRVYSTLRYCVSDPLRSVNHQTETQNILLRLRSPGEVVKGQCPHFNGRRRLRECIPSIFTAILFSGFEVPFF